MAPTRRGQVKRLSLFCPSDARFRGSLYGEIFRKAGFKSPRRASVSRGSVALGDIGDTRRGRMILEVRIIPKRKTRRR